MLDPESDMSFDESGEISAGRTEVASTLSKSRKIDSLPSQRCSIGLYVISPCAAQSNSVLEFWRNTTFMQSRDRLPLTVALPPRCRIRCGSRRRLSFLRSGSPAFAFDLPWSSMRSALDGGAASECLRLEATLTPSFRPKLPDLAVARLAPLLFLEIGRTTRCFSSSFETGRSSKASSSVPSPYGLVGVGAGKGRGIV